MGKHAAPGRRISLKTIVDCASLALVVLIALAEVAGEQFKDLTFIPSQWLVVLAGIGLVATRLKTILDRMRSLDAARRLAARLSRNTNTTDTDPESEGHA